MEYADGSYRCIRPTDGDPVASLGIVNIDVWLRCTKVPIAYRFRHDVEFIPRLL
jgi:hypothetical protein